MLCGAGEDGSLFGAGEGVGIEDCCWIGGGGTWAGAFGIGGWS